MDNSEQQEPQGIAPGAELQQRVDEKMAQTTYQADDPFEEAKDSIADSIVDLIRQYTAICMLENLVNETIMQQEGDEQ